MDSTPSSSVAFQRTSRSKMMIDWSDNTSISTLRTSTRSLGVRSSNLSANVSDDYDEEEETRKKANGLLIQKVETFQKHNKQHKGMKSFFRKNTSLNLSNLNVSGVPEEAVQIMAECNVERVCLARNESMVVAPDTLVQGGHKHRSPLTSLLCLDLSKCQIVILPEAWDLPNLTVLDLSHNRLRNFPSESVLKGVPLLRELNLYGNRLMQVPNFGGKTSVSQQRQLAREQRELSASQLLLHQQCSFRKSLTGRTGVCSASLVYDASLLTNLRILNVGYNDLSNLPERVPRSLRVLLASNNIISQVPADLVLTGTIKSLEVSSNPITDPPLRICEAGLKAMKKHFTAKDTSLRFTQTAGGGGWREHHLQQHHSSGLLQQHSSGLEEEHEEEDVFPTIYRFKTSPMSDSAAVVPNVVEFASSSLSNPFLAT